MIIYFPCYKMCLFVKASAAGAPPQAGAEGEGAKGESEERVAGRDSRGESQTPTPSITSKGATSTTTGAATAALATASSADPTKL